jgi:hypothetical protein
MNGVIQVPKLIEVYKNDFGKDKEVVIEFLYRYLENPEIDLNQCIDEVCFKKSLYLW